MASAYGQATGSPYDRATGSMLADEKEAAAARPTGRGTPAKLVRCLLRCPVRCAVILLAIILIAVGAKSYGTFKENMVVGSAPPPDSPSGVAKKNYDKYFNPQDVQVIVMMSSVSGEALLNTDAKLNSTEKWRHPEEYIETPLTPAARQISHELKATVDAALGTDCEYSFQSFWDILSNTSTETQQAIANVSGVAFERQLFSFCAADAAAGCVDGASTLAVVALRQCQGKYLSNDCVSQKKDWCDPISTLNDDLGDYVKAHDEETGVALRVVSMPAIFVSAQKVFAPSSSVCASSSCFSAFFFSASSSSSLPLSLLLSLLERSPERPPERPPRAAGRRQDDAMLCYAALLWQGVDKTMELSLLSAPFAFILLGVMLRNLRAESIEPLLSPRLRSLPPPPAHLPPVAHHHAHRPARTAQAAAAHHADQHHRLPDARRAAHVAHLAALAGLG